MTTLGNFLHRKYSIPTQSDLRNLRTIEYEELSRALAIDDFLKEEELKACFDRVDADRSGTLDFAEVYLSLTHDIVSGVILLMGAFRVCSSSHSSIFGLDPSQKGWVLSLLSNRIRMW